MSTLPVRATPAVAAVFVVTRALRRSICAGLRRALVGTALLWTGTAAADVAPEPPRLEIATWCDGDAKDAVYLDVRDGDFERHEGGFAWVIGPREHLGTCYLPWKESGELLPDTLYPAWVDLDVSGVWCGGEPSERERSVRQPEELIVRVPWVGRKVVVQVREMRGEVVGGTFARRGFGEWRTVVTRAVPDDHVLRVPMRDLVGTARHWIRVKVQVEGGPEETLDLIWPVGC